MGFKLQAQWLQVTVELPFQHKICSDLSFSVHLLPKLTSGGWKLMVTAA